MRVADQPGVLAKIAGALGDAGISIASVIQKELDGGGAAEIVIMTHEAREASMQSARGTFARMQEVHGVEQVLRVKS
jgi:homoserine dehydrogenase